MNLVEKQVREKVEKVLARFDVPRFELVGREIRTDNELDGAIIQEITHVTGYEFQYARIQKPKWEIVEDNVAHPKHYNTGKIEVIEVIEDQKLDYHLGNVVKYVLRAGKKDASKEVEDLKKAAWYLNRRIEVVEATNEGRSTLRPNDMAKKEYTAPAMNVESKLVIQKDNAQFEKTEGEWITVSIDEKEQVAFVPKMLKGKQLPPHVFIDGAAL